MKKQLVCSLALLPVMAMANYPIEVSEDLTGTEVTYDVQNINYNMGGLLLRNHGAVPVRCQALFRNGPEAPRTRKVLVQPHTQTHLTAKFTREILRLRVDLKCEDEG